MQLIVSACCTIPCPVAIMYLMYYLNDKSERVYTMAKVDPNGRPTISAHPGELADFLTARSCLTTCPLLADSPLLA